MKFQCDRCKTRYSIADERVRGKILKIRCKNCEAVITVREGMDAPSAKGRSAKITNAPPARQEMPAPRKGGAAKPKAKAPQIDSKPVLRGAFEKAMEAPPSGVDAAFDDDGDRTVMSDGPPQQLEEEWYVSLDGEQFGPFNLAEAKDWVGARAPGDELFCWSEGFDDWLPIEKVSQFRRARTVSAPPPQRPGPPPAPSMVARSGSAPVAHMPRSEETPKPLFAAAMANLEAADHSEPVEKILEDAKGPGGNGTSGNGLLDSLDDDDDGGGAFDFDVGEASRVVKMPVLAAAMRPSRAGAANAVLPGVVGEDSKLGNGTGGHSSIGRHTGPVVVPLSEGAMASASPEVLQPQRRTRHINPWYVIAGLAVVGAVAVFMLVLASGEEESGGRISRARARSEGLGVSLDPKTIKIVETREVPVDRGGKTGGTRRGSTRPETNGTGGNDTDIGKTDDFVFGGDDANRPLDGDDLMKVYRDNRLGVKLCYENALKKDPLLDVSKIYVKMSVAPSGVVTDVTLSSEADTPLGTCLTSRLRRWRFRKSPETFSGQFPLVFKN